MNKDVIGNLIALRRKLTHLLNSAQQNTVRHTLNELDIEIENLEMALNEQQGAALQVLNLAAEKSCRHLEQAIQDLQKGLDFAISINQALATLSKALA